MSNESERLFVALYDELHRIAERRLRGAHPNLTLGATTLLHEAYLSMAGREQLAFPDEPRFLAYASRAMRGLLLDYARNRRARKRGRQFEITLTGDELPSDEAVRATEELERL